MSIIKFSYSENSKEKTTIAQIYLGKNYETFELDTSFWNKYDYMNQWKHAIEYSLNHRQISGIIKNYEKITFSGIKNIGIYTIIPEEIAFPEKFMNIKENHKSKYFYITESFKFITENIENLDSNKSFELIKECYGDYFPIYYLNLNVLEHFYLYLSERVEGISHWKVTEIELKDTLNYLIQTKIIENE